jgi:hypothetical protein
MAEDTNTPTGTSADEMRTLLAEDRELRRLEVEKAEADGKIHQLEKELVEAGWAEQDAAIERAMAIEDQHARRAELIGSDTVEGALAVAAENGGAIPADRLTSYSNVTLKALQRRDRAVWYASLTAYSAAAIGGAL